MIIKSSYKTINRIIEFLYYNSCYIELYSNSFDCASNFGDILLDLLANCNKIENVDYSKFIVYIMLSKFCPNTHISLLPVIMFPDTLKPNYLENLTATLMYYKKCIGISNIMFMGKWNLEIRNYRYVIIENSLVAHICFNIIVKQEYKYSQQKVLANNFAYYLCLLF